MLSNGIIVLLLTNKGNFKKTSNHLHIFIIHDNPTITNTYHSDYIFVFYVGWKASIGKNLNVSIKGIFVDTSDDPQVMKSKKK